MKNTVGLMLLFCYMFPSMAQPIDKTARLPIDSAAADIEQIVKDKIPDHVTLVGIGEVAVFAKEATQFNTALAAYLIAKKNYRHVLLMEDEWTLRPLNDYLTGAAAVDTSVMNSLIRLYMDGYQRSVQFRSFLIWLKKYNSRHPQAMVDLSGIEVNTSIPPSYFLTAYIVPADRAGGIRLGRKWADKFYSDSSAFKDIEAWHRQALATPSLFGKNKELILRCGEDIEHNKAVTKVASLTQILPKEELDRKMNYTVSSILHKLGKHAILYASNKSIVKSDVRSNRIANGEPVASLGKLLYHKLSGSYYACATGFADSANLLIASVAKAKAEPTVLYGTMETKRLILQKDHFFMPADSVYIKQYRPSTISFFFEYPVTMVPDGDLIAVDALFLFPSLTTADIIPD